MTELELYQMEQLAEKVAELEKMNQCIPFGVMAFVGLIGLICIYIIINVVGGNNNESK